TERVDAPYALELRRISVDGGVAAAGDAGVVDEDVDGTEVGESGGDHGLVLFPRVDRRLVLLRPASELLDLGHRVGGGLLVTAVVDRDVGAVLGQRQRNGSADTAPSSGDERHPAFESHRISCWCAATGP